ncbi:MAG: PAS domain-containing protein [Candidatus Binatus sp.]
MDLLLVEDDPTDRMVIQARLRRGFPSARILAADDPVRLSEHLKRDGCDIVITDYWLGWSDGLSVLQRVRGRWPRTRVIMLTGNGGEEVVAGAFKHGLYHYLVKPDGFAELVPVIGAAIEAKRRDDFHELMAMIVNSIPDGIHCVDADGTITAINAAARQMYGYSDIEIIGRSSEMLLPAGRRDEVRRLLVRAFGGEIVPRFPTFQARIDGAEIAVEMTILPLHDGDGGVSNVACIATPIGHAIHRLAGPKAGPESHASLEALNLSRH